MRAAACRVLIGPAVSSSIGRTWQLVRQAMTVLQVAAICGGLFWFVSLYGSALRDPRFLDGWLLAVGMAVQLYLHVARKARRLTPKSAMRWRRRHILLGYVLVAAFLLHMDLTLPDTALEWALLACFAGVTASGIIGTYLVWSLEARRRLDDSVTYERIPELRARLAHEVEVAIDESDPEAALFPLPALPYDAWMKDLYQNRLRAFFEGQRHSAAHLVGSSRHLRRLTSEIDDLSRFVDQQGRDKLALIKSLVIEKDQLDHMRVRLGLSRAWLFVHVPVTYALVVLTLLHIVVVYAFTSGAS